MLGYYDMRSLGIHCLHRLLARFVDKVLKLSINRITFK